jgi:hypothetical protein
LFRSQVDHAENIEPVDWDTLQIVETHDDQDRIELISEDHMYELLGLREKETSSVLAQTFDCQMDEHCVDGADTHVGDGIPSEMVISYDKNNPPMEVGTLYPSMEEFNMVVRQFAINKEFDLGTIKSDKRRYRCYCKSSEDCPWKISGSKHKEQKIVKVN